MWGEEGVICNKAPCSRKRTSYVVLTWHVHEPLSYECMQRRAVFLCKEITKQTNTKQQQKLHFTPSFLSHAFHRHIFLWHFVHC